MNPCKRGHDRDVVGMLGRACRQCHRDLNRGVQRRARATKDGYAKDRCRSALNHAIGSGKVVKPEVCSGCGVACRIEAHHQDYTKPFEVRWLCHMCHLTEHGRRNAAGRSDQGKGGIARVRASLEASVA